MTLNESTLELSNNTYDIGLNGFKMASVYNKNFVAANLQSYAMQGIKNKLFYSFFSKTYGQCYSLDLTYIGLNMLPLQDVIFQFKVVVL